MELYPTLHRLVWGDKQDELEEALLLQPDCSKPDSDGLPPIDRKYRGVSPLGLACQLGRYKCAQVLLNYGASCYEASTLGFLPFQDANGYGDRELMRLLFTARHEQLQLQWAKREALLHQILCLVTIRSA